MSILELEVSLNLGKFWSFRREEHQLQMVSRKFQDLDLVAQQSVSQQWFSFLFQLFLSVLAYIRRVK